MKKKRSNDWALDSPVFRDQGYEKEPEKNAEKRRVQMVRENKAIKLPWKVNEESISRGIAWSTLSNAIDRLRWVWNDFGFRYQEIIDKILRKVSVEYESIIWLDRIQEKVKEKKLKKRNWRYRQQI